MLARLTSNAGASSTARAMPPPQRTGRGVHRAARRAAVVACETGSGEGLTYKKAGVDIDAGDELVRRIQKLNPSIGGFSGMVPFGDSFLVAGTDGVGTKLKLAFELNKHDTVGIDLVAMSVNDIVTSGAAPLFFLDYYATGALDVDAAEQVIKGIVEGCRQSGCQLLGGETAEMPGFYQKGEYDLAGFAVGAVKKDKLIEGKKNIRAGDQILGFASSGIHSNGFSLVRKVMEVSNTPLSTPVPWGAIGTNGKPRTFGDVLIEPTFIYVKKVLDLHDKVGLKGVVHITGGGMPENIPRVIPDGLGVSIRTNAYEVPQIFQWLQKTGNVPIDDLRRTFNMGVGMVVVVDQSNVETLQKLAPDAFLLGEVVEGDGVSFV